MCVDINIQELEINAYFDIFKSSSNPFKIHWHTNKTLICYPKMACWCWRVRKPWWAIATQALIWSPDCHPSYYLRTLANGSLNIFLFMQNYLGPRWPMRFLSNHVFQIVYILLQFKTLLHFPDRHRDINREVAIKT